MGDPMAGATDVNPVFRKFRLEDFETPRVVKVALPAKTRSPCQRTSLLRREG